MKYLVKATWKRFEDGEFTTVYKEFADMEQAEAFAIDVYKSYAYEITVLIYELKKAYN